MTDVASILKLSEEDRARLDGLRSNLGHNQPWSDAANIRFLLGIVDALARERGAPDPAIMSRG